MTLFEKFYEWWDNADFEDILIMAFMVSVTALVMFLLIALFVGVAMGGAQ